MNLLYDAQKDTFTAADQVAVVSADTGYKACRQELYDVLAKYSREDAIQALQKTLADWKSA